MPEFEIIFTEKIKSKTYIKAETMDEAEELFYDGELGDDKEIEATGAEIETIEEL